MALEIRIERKTLTMAVVSKGAGGSLDKCCRTARIRRCLKDGASNEEHAGVKPLITNVCRRGAYRKGAGGNAGSWFHKTIHSAFSIKNSNYRI